MVKPPRDPYNGRTRALSTRRAQQASSLASVLALTIACSRTSTVSPPPPVFHTGDAFTIEFTLPKPAYATLLHVGPRGDLSVVYPSDATTPRREIPAGERVRLPDPTEGSDWVFEGDPGWETFVLVTARASAPDLSALLANDPAADKGRSRAEIVSGVRSRLTRLGTVELIEVLHLP